MRILPRPLSQVLNDAVAGLGRTWKVLVPLAIVVFIPASLATLAAFSIPGALDFIETLLANPGELSDLDPEAFMERSRPFLIATTITVVVQALATIFVFVLCHRVAVADLKGEPVSWSTATKGALGNYAGAAIAGVLAAAASAGLVFLGLTFWSVPAATVGTPNATAGLVAVVLLVALLAPGLWLGTSLSMVTVVSAVERQKPFRAMSRSTALVKKRWWPTLGFLLLVGLLGSVALQLVQLVAIPIAASGGGGSAPFASLLGVLAQGPIVTAMGVTFTYWYLDLRARRETLTVDQL